MKHYEYRMLEASLKQGEWTVTYLGKEYSKSKYLQAIMDYLGTEGWELVNTTSYSHGEEAGIICTENFYFKREHEGAGQKVTLQSLIDEIDRYTHEIETAESLEEEAQLSEEEYKQMILEHLYDWLKHHEFEWGQPGYGVKESHYLNNHYEDVTEDDRFEGYTDKQKVSIRVDIFKEDDCVGIDIKKRINGDWIDTGSHRFTFDKDGIGLIRKTMRMERSSLNEL
jgi:hypothetical protein